MKAGYILPKQKNKEGVSYCLEEVIGVPMGLVVAYGDPIGTRYSERLSLEKPNRGSERQYDTTSYNTFIASLNTACSFF